MKLKDAIVEMQRRYKVADGKKRAAEQRQRAQDRPAAAV